MQTTLEFISPHSERTLTKVEHFLPYASITFKFWSLLTFSRFTLETPRPPMSVCRPRPLILPSLKDMSNSVRWNYLAPKVIYACTGPKNISLIAGLVIERAQSLLQHSQAPSPGLPRLDCASKVRGRIKMLKSRKRADPASSAAGKLFLV